MTDFLRISAEVRKKGGLQASVYLALRVRRLELEVVRHARTFPLRNRKERNFFVDISDIHLSRWHMDTFQGLFGGTGLICGYFGEG